MILMTALVFGSTQIIHFNIATAQLNSTGPPLIHEDDLASQNGSSVYEDKDVGFTIKYPSDWTLGDKNTQYNTVASFDSPNGDASVNVRVFPQSTYKSLKDFGNTFKKGDDYTLIAYYRNSTTLLDGKPAFKAIYLTTYNPSIFEAPFGYKSSTSKGMFIATLVPEKKSYYAFAYFNNPSSFDDYIPLVEEMAKSFHIGTKGPTIQED
jgi:hypothetical protein